jgi:hypothetical protein
MSSSSKSNCSFGPDSSPLLHPGDVPFHSRRDFLVRSGLGMGGLSLAALFGINPFDADAADPMGPLAPKAPHFPVKAKAIIQIFAGGAPSTVDTKKNPRIRGPRTGIPFQVREERQVWRGGIGDFPRDWQAHRRHCRDSFSVCGDPGPRDCREDADDRFGTTPEA